MMIYIKLILCLYCLQSHEVNTLMERLDIMEMCFIYTFVHLCVCMCVFLKLQKQITSDTVLTSVSHKLQLYFNTKVWMMHLCEKSDTGQKFPFSVVSVLCAEDAVMCGFPRLC
jgi:hypothetical protein